MGDRKTKPSKSGGQIWMSKKAKDDLKAGKGRSKLLVDVKKARVEKMHKDNTGKDPETRRKNAEKSGHASADDFTDAIRHAYDYPD